MTAAQFFGVLAIGFLLGVAFAAWRQVEYELRRERRSETRIRGSVAERPHPDRRKPW
jgi:hypothetical protein